MPKRFLQQSSSLAELGLGYRDLNLEEVMEEVTEIISIEGKDDPIGRLRYLLMVRRRDFEEFNEKGFKFMDESITYTFLDCVRIGRKGSAQAIVRDEHEELPDFIVEQLKNRRDPGKQGRFET